MENSFHGMGEEENYIALHEGNCWAEAEHIGIHNTMETVVADYCDHPSVRRKKCFQNQIKNNIDY